MSNCLVKQNLTVKASFNAPLEIYLLTTYIDQTTINEQYQIQYIGIEVNEDEVDFSLMYSSITDRYHKATETEREKTRQRIATETIRKKSQKRNETED